MGSKVDDIRERTKQDLIEKLSKYHKCVVPRPTGFGKTCLLTDMIKRYKNVLYLYPAEVIKNTVLYRYSIDDEIDEETREMVKEMKEIPNVTLMTYMKLIKLKKDDFDSMSYDLVIMDEVHRVGGEQTKIAVEKLFDTLKSSDFIGATATPNRSDSFDVIDFFFDNICVFSYTLHDAFQDKVLKIPFYCYCSYPEVENIKEDLKEAALTAGEDIDNIVVRDVLSKKLIEISNIFNMPNIISEVCGRYVKDDSYMKFIVFFDGIQHLKDKSQNVISWFHKAYPEHRIVVTEITSESEESEKRVKELDRMTRESNKIDLIMSVDMLNMGYHVEDMSGILMYRGTSSDIVYIQQLGRALSSGSDNSCVVFDVVDNLHRKGEFDFVGSLDDDGNKISRKGKKRGKSSVPGSGAGHSIDTIDINGGIPGNEVCGGTLPKPVNGKLPEGYDSKFYYIDTETNTIKFKWWTKCCDFEPEDLHPVGNMSTYKELIAKTVAEPMTQRCMEAFEAHFRRWCTLNNVDYPISDKELEEAYGLDKEDFVKFFMDKVKEEGIDYPMGDAQKLLDIGKTSGKGIPMDVFAKWKNVRVSAILDMLGVA